MLPRPRNSLNINIADSTMLLKTTSEVSIKHIWIKLLAILIFSVTINCDSESVHNDSENQQALSPATYILRGGTNIMQWSTSPDVTIDQGKTYTAVMQTNKGDITFALFSEEAPITVNNFIFLSRAGFYDSIKFHRIIKGFMAQTGDPTGTGSGGPGYRFNDELVTREYLRGTIAMANSGPNTNGSQFFIMHQNYPLPKNYTIFGIATQGMDVIDDIANTPVSVNPSGEPSTPTEEITINGIAIIET